MPNIARQRDFQRALYRCILVVLLCPLVCVTCFQQCGCASLTLARTYGNMREAWHYAGYVLCV
jgi:hypothetical protein